MGKHETIEVPRGFTGMFSSSELLNPTKLAVTPTALRRVLVIGSCFAQSLAHCLPAAFPDSECDYILFNYAHELPEQPPRPIAEYDFIVIMPALRTVMNEGGYIRLPYTDPAAYQAFFDACVTHLNQLVDGALKYTRAFKKTTFFLNFLAPQGSYMGRLIPKRDLRNPAHFCERLNIELEKFLASEPTTYLIDLDDIGCSLGKRWFHDDSLVASSHGAFIPDWELHTDQKRLDRAIPLAPRYNCMTPTEVLSYLWRELAASFRVVQQTDSIKLVVTDLDDTLWNGVLMDNEPLGHEATEGWPMGYIEALQILRKRGVLLGIISKNEFSYIAGAWASTCRGLIELSDFAAVKINWEPKTRNMEELLSEVSLLPQNVLFIDDNPVERAAMAAAFPEMRIIGGDPYELRHLLLRSPETQVPILTEEAGRRTEMVQAQVEREQARKKLTREEFLATVSVKLHLFEIAGQSDGKYARAFELLNKTNQFNTTGRRWTHEEIANAWQHGTRIFAFEVEDRYTKYGLVGVLLLSGNTFVQFVMSCRVLGLGIEAAVLSDLSAVLRDDGFAEMTASIVETKSNIVSRDAWQKSGFNETSPGMWSIALDRMLDRPSHVS